ncbi:NADH dehydrogenase [ubiquinone] 1 alpha subcomplex subunit 6 [Capsicum baccatum]|uniref:NADH dehydrogenase [ubiquinone] 1 alpha subcomplex subunit 6 n=2 Tax=Capsicum TaxID=4071 RepID=A0A1U8GJI0_CAPAN|nr:NADH dehydrogenase [ubiquinone] 1 alpha subcomplex subunit 6 [Capsicum annuum]KAF3667322.1 NADH dehydrogenase [ubiquinone] 1 alpha subcomplex subunit 6 [Capsicum annuum]PHT50967.1 NADH dehydrogenase [ubiquinone] 1 alpha subcomplex subunit 6 [Capsicum baccatum]PHT92944.1 NADH dehydrogenase [ubiquinone] 1 alpha subcomplex subunit 6 [Capsicum annuum]PHU28688.1 NADH dehydrogenase [ubiquinone] 1 alpha subcomplex subunit 6 [Capsicum chinense]
MAHIMLKKLKVPANSGSLEEARSRTFEFFRMCCRSIPHIMEIYNLYDVVTPSQLRSAAAAEVRKNSNVTNPKVIDMLLFKGTEELMNIVNQSKQRHHIVGQYVVGNQGLVQDLAAKDQDTSNFLKNFYGSNYS